MFGSTTSLTIHSTDCTCCYRGQFLYIDLFMSRFKDPDLGDVCGDKVVFVVAD